MAASCDILIASTMAEMGLPEINVGLLGGAKRTMRLFGHSKVRRMMFTGYRVKAPELKELGVVECVVPPEELMNTAMSYARRMLDMAPREVRNIKQMLYRGFNMSPLDAQVYGGWLEQNLQGMKDSVEGPLAFSEKRRPNFVDG